MNIEVIVLAAGKGTRMYSQKPKVLHELGGQPMLTHVMQAAQSLSPQNIHVVTGYQCAMIHEHYAADSNFDNINWVEQAEQLGTGHAVMQAAPHLKDDSVVLVLYADVPLVNTAHLLELAALAEEHGIAVLTLDTDQPHGLGRIIRDPAGHIVAIVEEKDASPEQRHITEINTGIMAFNTRLLKSWLTGLDTGNAQGEYYLTDTVAIATAEGNEVVALQTQDKDEVQGVNNRLQLAELERAWQLRHARTLALQGVTIMDPARLDIRGSLQVGRDVVIDVNVIFEGNNKLGNNVRIGPNVTIIASTIADGTVILAYSHLENVTIAESCTVGPFARLRPGTILNRSAKIGNFVETKKASIGEASKVNHLSYIGDAEIGDNVNVGAGTITCNYDGVNKFKTIIKSGAFIGSNTALVAPVSIGVDATVGAGSVITSDVKDQDLAVARGRQKNISCWKRPTKQLKE